MQNLEEVGIIWSHMLQTFYFFKKNQILKNHLEKINAAEEIARHFTTKKQLE